MPMEGQGPISGWLEATPIVAFDTETTGLWAPSERIVEIGAVRRDSAGAKLREFGSLINPGRPIPETVTAIHGITDEMVADAPPASEVLPRFVEFCRGAVLVAHNAPFDIGFVGWELNRSGLNFGEDLILDTVDIYRRFFPGQVSYSLLSLSRAFGFAQDQRHRAVDDARLVMTLLQHASPVLSHLTSEDNVKAELACYRMQDWQAREIVLPEEFIELERAIHDAGVIEMVYASQGKPPQARRIRPMIVHCQGDVLYVNAYCFRARAERTFRLDRIQSFRVVDSAGDAGEI